MEKVELVNVSLNDNVDETVAHAAGAVVRPKLVLVYTGALADLKVLLSKALAGTVVLEQAAPPAPKPAAPVPAVKTAPPAPAAPPPPVAAPKPAAPTPPAPVPPAAPPPPAAVAAPAAAPKPAAPPKAAKAPKPAAPPPPPPPAEEVAEDEEGGAGDEGGALPTFAEMGEGEQEALLAAKTLRAVVEFFSGTYSATAAEIEAWVKDAENTASVPVLAATTDLATRLKRAMTVAGVTA